MNENRGGMVFQIELRSKFQKKRRKNLPQEFQYLLPPYITTGRVNGSRM